MHRAYQPMVPATNLYLQEKWDRSRYEEHRRKVLMALPAVNTKGLHMPAHLLVNMKKIQMEKERREQIAKQNQSHYAKLSAIRASQGRLDNWNNYPHHSLNLGSRMRNLEEITLENGKMLGRILKRESEYRKWEFEWEKVKQLQARICRYPRISGPSEGDHRVGFQNFRRNSRILDPVEKSEAKSNTSQSTLESISGRTSLGSTRATSVISDKKRQVISSAQSGKSKKTSSIEESTDCDTDRKSSDHVDKAVTSETRSHSQKNYFKSQRNSKSIEDVQNIENKIIKHISNSRKPTPESNSESDLHEETQTEEDTQEMNKQEMVSSWNKLTSRATITSESTTALSDGESDQGSYFSLAEFEDHSHYSPRDSKRRSLPPTGFPDFQGRSLPPTKSQDSQESSFLSTKCRDSLESSLSPIESQDSQGSLLQSSEFLASQTSPIPSTESQDSHGSPRQPTESQDSHGSPRQPTESQDSHGSPRQPTESQDSHGSPRQPTESQDSHGSPCQPTESQDSHRKPVLPTQYTVSQRNPLPPTESRDSQRSPVLLTESPVSQGSLIPHTGSARRLSDPKSIWSENRNMEGVTVLTPKVTRHSLDMSSKQDKSTFVPLSQGSSSERALSQDILVSEAQNKLDSSLEDDRYSEASPQISNVNMNPSLKAFSRSSISSIEN